MKPALKLALIFVIWRLGLELILRLAVNYLPFHPTFPYYNTNLEPRYSRVEAAWAHFDGVHYLRLSEKGYVDVGTQAFFPLYPGLIRLTIAKPEHQLYAAVGISNLLFFLSLLVLQRLVKPALFWRGLPLLLLFPVSFFFAAVYTESLFLFLSLLFFYFLRDNRYFPAALTAALASGTRFIGIVFAPILVMNYLYQNRTKYSLLRSTFYLLLSLSGFLLYAYFLYRQFGDPLAFIHVQPMFGAGRSGGEIVLLPVVIYRYLKIFLTTDPSSLLFLRALGEFSIFSLFSYILIRYWRRFSRPELLFAAFALLLPTLSGTLSSIPRYALIIFPVFPVLAARLSRPAYLLTLTVFTLLLVASFSLFLMGEFIA
jgi:hypothetical protein